MRNYLSITQDVNWFNNNKKNGCKMTKELSKFWASRVEFNDARNIYEITSKYYIYKNV